MKASARGGGGDPALGRRGERLAARYLVRHGYRVLEANLTVCRDEADLIVLDPDRETVVIVEVKTRRSGPIEPETGIDHGKRRRLTRLAYRIRGRPQYADRPMRFDVVCITFPPGARPDVRHYVSAFDAAW